MLRWKHRKATSAFPQRLDSILGNSTSISSSVRSFVIVSSAAMTSGELGACDINSLVRAADSAAEAQHQTAALLRPQVFCVGGVIEAERAT